MKFIFASDIHGSLAACKAIIHQLQEEKADRLILLGDLLYHGPRNPLPEDYNPLAVSDMLNALPVKPLCVRGNCDSEVDQMVLDFPIMADYIMLPLYCGHVAFITHGHLYNIQNVPQLSHGDILIHGHTHIHTTEEHAGVTYINPGSSALPHEGQPKSYMTLDWEQDLFEIKAFDGKVLKSFHA